MQIPFCIVLYYHGDIRKRRFRQIAACLCTYRVCDRAAEQQHRPDGRRQHEGGAVTVGITIDAIGSCPERSATA